MTFGENLRTLRNSRSLSQKELADILGFSFQNISKWERNDSLPDIETLLAIAKFFGTTTDALLSHAPEKKFSTLKIDCNEVKLYKTYPEEVEKVTGDIVFVIDGEGKITATVWGLRWHPYRVGYIRRKYEPMDDDRSTIIYEYSYYYCNKLVVDNKKIKLPDGGFVISMSDSEFATKQILQFVIPEEYLEWLSLDPHREHCFYDMRHDKFFFSDVLKHNELDHITVDVSDRKLIFKKPADELDPMSINIEALAKIVRKELEKAHIKQIEELKNRIGELSDMTEDNESCISELQGRIEELESKIMELESRLE